jgi:hypothetical protein
MKGAVLAVMRFIADGEMKRHARRGRPIENPRRQDMMLSDSQLIK